MPSLIPRAHNRSDSSSNEDSKDDSEVDEWNLRHNHRIIMQQSTPAPSPVNSHDFGDSNSIECSVNSEIEDKVTELAERYNDDGTTWEEPDRSPNPTQSQNPNQQRPPKPNLQTDLPVAYNEMPNFKPTTTS